MLPVVLHIEVPERTNDTKRTDRVDRVTFRKRAIAGRAIDNVMIERLWRTVKYENIYLKEYTSGADCHQGLQAYFQYYCHERPHQSLSNRTPWHAYQTARRPPR